MTILQAKKEGRKEDYSTKELYGLCVKEVSPDLRDALCSHLLVKQAEPKKAARDGFICQVCYF